MPYTMTRGASNKPTLYTLKHGFDKRVMERVTKKGFWVMPAIVFLTLSLATLTSNQWYGHSDKKGSDAPKSLLTSSGSETTNDKRASDSTAASWKETSTPSASNTTGSPAASSSAAGSALQTTSPITNVVGGRGGEPAPTGSTPSPTPTVTPSTPTTPPVIPVVTVPETPPTTTEPVPTAPTHEPNLLCTPDLLGVIPSTCL